MKASYEDVQRAEKVQQGGKYRLLLQRIINGHKCRCFARVVIVGVTAYWSITYVIDGREAESFTDEVRIMAELVEAKSYDLCKNGKETILWRY